MATAKPIKQKHIPLRTCIVTREKKPKNELMRIVRIGDEDSGFSVEIDPKGKKAGRGANLLPNLETFDLAVQRGSIERSLNLGRKLKVEEIAELRSQFEQAIWEKEFRQGNRRVVLKVTKQELSSKLGE